MQIQFSTTLGPYFAELVCRACGTVCLRRPRFGPMLGAFGTYCRMYGSTLGCVGPIFAHVGPMLVMLGNVGPASGPYCAYLEPFRAALEQGRPANTAAQQQPAQQGHPPGMGEQQGHILAQQQGHKLGHPSNSGAGQPAQQQTNMAGGEPAQQ